MLRGDSGGTARQKLKAPSGSQGLDFQRVTSDNHANSKRFQFTDSDELSSTPFAGLLHTFNVEVSL